MEFVIYDDDDVAPFLEGLEERPQRKVLLPVQGFYEVQFGLAGFNLRNALLIFLLLLCCTV